MMHLMNQMQMATTGGGGLFEQVRSYVLANYSSTITIEQLARFTGLSRYRFCRQFYREFHVPPIRWLWQFRVLLAAHKIERKPTCPIALVGFECGFKSAAHFSRAFKAQMGVTPTHFRRMQRTKGPKTGLSREIGSFLGLMQNELMTELVTAAVRTA